MELQFTTSIIKRFIAFYKPLLEEKSMRIFIIIEHRRRELADYLKSSSSIENELLFSWLFFLTNFEEEIKISENNLFDYLIEEGLNDEHKNKIAKLLQKLLKKKEKPKKSYIYTFPLSENTELNMKDKEFDVLVSKAMELLIKKMKTLQRLDEIAYRFLKLNLTLAKINETDFTSNKNYIILMSQLRKIIEVDKNTFILIKNDRCIQLNKKDEKCFRRKF